MGSVCLGPACGVSAASPAFVAPLVQTRLVGEVPASGAPLSSLPVRPVPATGRLSGSAVAGWWDAAPSQACVAAAAAAALAAVRRRGASRGVALRATKAKNSFGPQTYEAKQKEDALKDEVARRVSYVVCENAKGIQDQLRQYGYSQIDGFLGGSIHGYPDRVRDEMKALFDRGWFQSESEEEASFKVGPYRITNQDTAYRFRSKLLGCPPGDKAESAVETQFEVAPTVVHFTRSAVLSLGSCVQQLVGGTMSPNVAIAEMMVMVGNGARYDRRVSNEFGWFTEQGFVPDPRKVTAIYFANPQYREELGGHLQLEGVITPTGAASVAPIHDRLVLFWADKTVWSMRPCQSSKISEHHYSLVMHLMVEDKTLVKYNPLDLARWFPELQGKPIEWPPAPRPIFNP